MLFMHEVHKVRGRAEDEFEAAIRQGWMPTIGAGDDARLMWYTNHARQRPRVPRRDSDGCARRNFDDVPVDGRDHELTLYMEDTMWPHEDRFLEYIDRCDEVYSKSLDLLRGHRCTERNMNIGTIIDAAVVGDPARTALIVDGRAISYGELAAAVEQCSAGLAASGVAGKRVAVVDVGNLL